MNGNQYNGMIYGQPQQGTGFVPNAPMNGAPVPGPVFAGQPQNGFAQPSQAYAPQQNNAQPQGQSGSYAAGQDHSQQEQIRYTQILCSPPSSGKLEDLQMTVFLSINMEKLFFEKFMSKNGNLCVGVNMDLVLGDQFVSQMFGQQMVRPDHVVSVSTILGGYNAKRFLERTPNSTKVIALLLKDFKMESFNRRDGSSGINVQASCDGYQVIHYSSKHKASDVKQCNLPESKPFYIKDRTNGASGSQQNVQQQGTGTVPPNAFSQPVPVGYPGSPAMVPGVTAFAEMDDEELPF